MGGDWGLRRKCKGGGTRGGVNGAGAGTDGDEGGGRLVQIGDGEREGVVGGGGVGVRHGRLGWCGSGAIERRIVGYCTIDNFSRWYAAWEPQTSNVPNK